MYWQQSYDNHLLITNQRRQYYMNIRVDQGTTHHPLGPRHTRTIRFTTQGCSAHVDISYPIDQYYKHSELIYKISHISVTNPGTKCAINLLILSARGTTYEQPVKGYTKATTSNCCTMCRVM